MELIRGYFTNIIFVFGIYSCLAQAPDSMPRHLAAVVTDGDPLSVTLSWQAPKVAEQIEGFIVYYTTEPTRRDTDWVVEAVLGDRLSAAITGLRAATTYYFKVQSRLSTGYGSMSPTVSITTSPAHTSAMTQIVNVCCELGTEWASRNKRCDDFNGEIANIADRNQLVCRQVLEVCCIKSKQGQMCTRGVTDGLTDGNRCVIRDDVIGAVTYKECCQCCQMGLTVRQMGMRCSSPSIGNPCDKTFMQCCQQDSDISIDWGDGGDGDNTDVLSLTEEPSSDIDECTLFGARTLCSQICINTIGSFRCDCRHGHKLAGDGRTCYRDNCHTGYAFNTVSGQCEDLDECVIGTHDCSGNNEICLNRRGGFYCQCDDGFHRNRTNSMCEDIDECARRMDTCTASQRCENTAGSFACRRITPCGTGWTLDEKTQECIDQDECEIGTDNCGSGYECFNIEGSFRCNPKRCPEGSRYNVATAQCERIICPRGLRPDTTSLCVDINECEARVSPCRSFQACQNNYGSYRCIDSVQCGPGYEIDTDGQTCIDIDECLAGTHECRGGAECINRQGSYVCSCPPGFRRIGGVCKDKNECNYGNVCPNNAVCENTRGSFRCVCDAGFEEFGSQRCRDINECLDPAICTQRCTNLVGSYVCTCESGYKLASDGRRCQDIDECKLYNGPGVCAGGCVNTPGSYRCSCPSGWRIMGNGRSCQDVDECQEHTDSCGSNDDLMCFNTRGSHRCPRVMCPRGFSRSELGPRRNSVRCKRRSFTCQTGDKECLTAPLSLSYNFLTFPTNVKIPTDLFSMSGPFAREKSFQWSLNITSAYSRRADVTPVMQQDFDLRIGQNNAVVSLVNRIEGPQDVELMLTMQITDIYLGYTGHAISRIYLYITSDKII